MSSKELSHQIEIEISQQLSMGLNFEQVAATLVEKYKNKRLTLLEFETLANFFLASGQVVVFNDFVGRKLKASQPIPWGHFCESLFLSSSMIGPRLKQALIDASESQVSLNHLARSQKLDHFDDLLPQQREKRRLAFLELYEVRKKDFLQELEILHAQQLYKEEAELIDKLLRMYPGDPEILKRGQKAKEKQALDILQSRPPQSQKPPLIPQYEIRSQEELSILKAIVESMKEALKTHPQMKLDFSMAHFMWEDYENTLELLPQEEPVLWLKAEALLRARKFVELLDLMSQVGGKMQEDPDVAYSVLYYNAQAYWGMNQKQKALDMMEALVHSKPDYRSAEAILAEWKLGGQQ